jgi:hypothetical protein
MLIHFNFTWEIGPEVVSGVEYSSLNLGIVDWEVGVEKVKSLQVKVMLPQKRLCRDTVKLNIG